MGFNDAEWLGKENAHLGPMARAAIGVLLFEDDWDWWYERDATRIAKNLDGYIRPGGILRWGGKYPIKEWAHWCDPDSAIAAAHGWKAFLNRHEGGVSIKALRRNWIWSDPGVDALLDDLAKSGLAPGHIFFEWPVDRRPRRKRSQNHEETMNVGIVNEWDFPLAQFMSDALTETDVHAEVVRSDEAHVDVLVTSASPEEIALGEQETDLVIQFSEDTYAVVPELDQLRQGLHAQAIISVNTRNRKNWLTALTKAWGEGHSILGAVQSATQLLRGGTSPLIVSTQQALLDVPDFVSRWGRRHGVRVAGDVTRVIGKVANKIIDPTQGLTGGMGTFISRSSFDFTVPPVSLKKPPPVNRVLDCAVAKDGAAVDTFPTSGDVDIAVSIIPRGPDVDPNRPNFPEELVQWEGEEKKLNVHLIEFGKTVKSKTMTLPRTSASDPVTFNYTVENNAAVDLRILVCDGANILQTARLQSGPERQVVFFIEALVRPTDAESKAFDLALLVNDSLGGKNVPSVSAFKDDAAGIYTLSEAEIEMLFNRIKTRLVEMTSAKAPNIEKELRTLARSGSVLYKKIKEKIPLWSEKVQNIQVVTATPNAYFPVEFLYELTVPDKEAPYCPNPADCLEEYTANSECIKKDTGEVVCPMGFLGLSKTIERHAYSGMPISTFIALRFVQNLDRESLCDIDEVVFAAADEADNFRDDNFIKTYEVAEKLNVDCLHDWDAWKTAIKEQHPSLLLVVAHFGVDDDDEEFITIGEDENLYQPDVKSDHVGSNSPLALLLGCNSADSDIGLLGLPYSFQDHGSPIVIGMLTNVLGRHTNQIAQELTQHIQEASKDARPVKLGELIRRLRGKFLAKNIPTGLALVAYGDADFVLGGRGV